MLTARQLDDLPDPVLELFYEFEDTVIRDIARRLAGMDYATATAAWQAQKLSEAGMLYDDILRRLSVLTHKSEGELRRVFARAGVKALRFDDAVYRKAGLNPLPLNLSPNMAAVLAAGLRKTGGLMRNLTMTTAQAGQDAFIQAADLAYMQVSTGTLDYITAIRRGVKSVAAQGLAVIQFSQRRDQLDVAMRRAVLTGVNQTVGRLQWARADEMGVDLVQTTAHAGARPAHQLWQGKIFSRSGTSTKYPNFITETGYGTGPGLMGWGCRHNFYAFFEGISQNAYNDATLKEYENRTVRYKGQEMSFYEATQLQRGYERSIRRAKREQMAVEEAGFTSTQEAARVKELQSQLREFIRQTGLQRQRERESI